MNSVGIDIRKRHGVWVAADEQGRKLAVAEVRAHPLLVMLNFSNGSMPRQRHPQRLLLGLPDGFVARLGVRVGAGL